MEYLQNQLNFTYKQALVATREEANNPETQKMFKEFAEQNVVICNRQPSLHEYSMFACKIRLNEEGNGDYAIRFPIGLCEPLNA